MTVDTDRRIHPTRVGGWLRRAFGTGPTRRLAGWAGWVARIGAIEPELTDAPDDELCRRTRNLRRRALEGVDLDDLLCETFAVVREAARRHVDMRPFDVQLLGGIALHQRCVVEMVTGEGKTLAATLPAALNALTGRGVHIVTINDYLARRDAEWMGAVYRALGLSVGCIQTDMPEDRRRQAYACDVTYGTAKEFGFDFLRDRLKIDPRRLQVGDRWYQAVLAQMDVRPPACVQRARHHYAIVDEADSILIDEARTPLIISGPGADQDVLAAYRWADSTAAHLEEDVHFEYDPDRRKAELLPGGRQRVREFSTPSALWDRPSGEAPYEYVERALEARHGYQHERDYLIVGGKIVIVDEFTGRMMPGRQWSRGLHQAIEAKEGVEINVATTTLARTTVQYFFKRYDKLAGMTGTARTAAGEFRRIYGLRTMVLPPNRPVHRHPLPDRVYGTEQAKLQAALEQILHLHRQGRPVLVGTRSVEKSQHLSRLLTETDVPHQVLNAKQHEQEAAIVAQAGQRAAVTIATNMAGRGTDIVLGDGVADLGGLHVIGTERHESRRIDNQLLGRAGRQGDPGSSQFLLCLEDELLRDDAQRFERRKAALDEGRVSRSAHARLLRRFYRAQRRVERRNFKARKLLMEYEEAREKWKKGLGMDPLLGE